MDVNVVRQRAVGPARHELNPFSRSKLIRSIPVVDIDGHVLAPGVPVSGRIAHLNGRGMTISNERAVCVGPGVCDDLAMRGSVGWRKIFRREQHEHCLEMIGTRSKCRPNSCANHAASSYTRRHDGPSVMATLRRGVRGQRETGNDERKRQAQDRNHVLFSECTKMSYAEFVPLPLARKSGWILLTV